MKKILFCCFVLLCNICWGQITFRKNYGNADYDWARCVQQTRDSGYILAGQTKHPVPTVEAALIKTNKYGDTLWIKTYGGSGNEEALYVEQTDDNGYIAVGFSDQFGPGAWSCYIFRTNANGDTLWTRAIGGVLNEIPPRCIRQTSDHGFIFTTGTGSYGAGDWDIYLVKLDGNGNMLWAKTYGGVYSDIGYYVVQTADGGYAVTGVSGSFVPGSTEMFLLRTDSAGNLLWFKTYGGSGYDWAHTMQQTYDGGFIMAGYINADSTSSVHGDICIIKTDANGDTMWTRKFTGGPVYNTDILYSVIQTRDSGYAIAGPYMGNPNASLFIKMDMDLDVVWVRHILNASIYSVRETYDGGYVLGGVATNASAYDFALIKTDADGNAFCQYGTQSTVMGWPQINVQSFTPFVSSGAIATGTNTVVGSDCKVIPLCPQIAEEIPGNNPFQIYPNPANNILNVECKMQNAELKIYDMTGRIVLQEALHTPLSTVNCPLSTGLYFVRVEAGDKVYQQKLVIE